MSREESRLALKTLLYHIGITNLTHSTFECFYHLFEQHLILSAKSIMSFAELNNRTKPTWKDLRLALEHVASIADLEEFCRSEIQLAIDLKDDSGVSRQPPVEESDGFPIGTAAPAILATQDPETYKQKRIAVPEHLPEFPPPHSYLQTKMPLHPLKEDFEFRKQNIEQKTVMERNLRNLLLNSFSLNGVQPLCEFDVGFADFTVNKLP